MLAFGLMIAFILVYFLIYLRQTKRRKQENSLSHVEQFHDKYRQHTQGNQKENEFQPGLQTDLQTTSHTSQPSNKLTNSGFPQPAATHYKRKPQPQRNTYTKYVTKYNSTEDYREKYPPHTKNHQQTPTKPPALTNS